MKISSLKRCLLLLVVSAVYFSCSQKGPKDLILGTWTIAGSKMSANDNSKVEITFYKNGIAKSDLYQAGKLANTDSITYVLTNDGKYLDTKEKSGRNDRVKIMELTETTMKIKPENEADSVAIVLTKK